MCPIRWDDPLDEPKPPATARRPRSAWAVILGYLMLVVVLGFLVLPFLYLQGAPVFGSRLYTSIDTLRGPRVRVYSARLQGRTAYAIEIWYFGWVLEVPQPP